MEKKYIIELEDVPFNRHGNYADDGTELYRIKGFNSLVFDRVGLDKLTSYTEPDLEQVRKDAYEDGYKTAKVQCDIQAEKDLRKVGERHYQKGLSDAWTATKKLFGDAEYGALTLSEFKEIFGEDTGKGLEESNALEIIEKLKAYEEKKKADREIHVGDEVKLLMCNLNIVVTCIKAKQSIFGLFHDGTTAIVSIDDCKKTGRHFDNISDFLNEGKE